MRPTGGNASFDHYTSFNYYWRLSQKAASFEINPKFHLGISLPGARRLSWTGRSWLTATGGI